LELGTLKLLTICYAIIIPQNCTSDLFPVNGVGTALASYSFDARSRRTELDYANGASAAYSYDTASRLLYVDNQTGNGQHKYSYMYDNVGNRTSMTVTDNSGTGVHVYSYDNIYQLTRAEHPAGLDYLAGDATFAYDAAGNRSSVLSGTAVLVDQEIAADLLGNLTYAPESGYTGRDSFQWNDSDGSLYATDSARVNLRVSAGQNLARNKAVVASSSVPGYEAAHATDGSTGSRWSSEYSDDQWIYVDLGAVQTFRRIVLCWEAAYGSSYKLQVSNNASSWTDVYSTTAGDGGVDEITLAAPASARYVRMLGLARATEYGYSLWEFEVYSGDPLNLAWNGPATASSSYTGFPAAHATDGNGTTRWSSTFSDSQWIYVDLGVVCRIDRIVLRWETAYGKDYKLQVSDNASTWWDVYTVTDGDGGVDEITLAAPAYGRYVRMLGIHRGTTFGYSLYEFEVYGEVAPSAGNVALNKTMTASSTYTGFPAGNAADGNGATRWSSLSTDNEWIYADLGVVCRIDRITLRWETAYGKGYKLQVSDDASAWSDIYTTTTGDGGLDEITLAAPESGRYVRMLGTERGTTFGYSLWEFEIYGGVFTEHAPVVRDVHRNLPQDTRLSFTSTDFSDAFAGEGHSLNKVKIASLPAHGVLRLDGTCTYTTNDLNQYTAAGTVNYTYDLSGNMTADERFTYTYDAENRLVQVKRAGQGPEPLSNACDTTLVFSTGGAAEWFAEAGGYYDNDSARSGAIGQNEESRLQTTVEGSGTISFWWAIAGGTGDTLEFYIDDVLQENGGTIGGNSGWLERWYPLDNDSHIFKWIYKRAGSSTGGCGWVDKVVWQTDRPAGSLADALDSPLAFTTGGAAAWYVDQGGNIHESEQGQFPKSNIYSAVSGFLQSPGESWLETQVEGSGTISFWAKVASGTGGNELRFEGQGVNTWTWSSEKWEYHSAAVGAGSHTLRWTYKRNDLDVPGQAFVDYVQWTGPLPPPPPDPAPTNWQTLTYVYDAAGRRVEKQYNQVTVVKYVYDGDRCIAEYNRYDQLLRKYIYGPGVDEPICMIEATTGSYTGTYYYHFDALGSVVALTNSSGNTVQVYEYDVYGQVGSSDLNHPNRFLFTGREYDKETDLYFYRARYYNPQIGRFLQTDPVGYDAGMNLYEYCENDAVNLDDPFGESANWETLSRAGYGYRVKNGDKRTYYLQEANWACGPTSIANLYVARDMRNTLANRIWNEYPDVRTGSVNLYAILPQYFMVMVENQLLNEAGRPRYAKNTSLTPRHDWANEGVADYGIMANVINMGYFDYIKKEIRPGAASLGLVTDYIKQGPVLMKFRTDKVEKREDGISYHSVVVRWCPTAQSHRPTADGKEEWIATPYEVIDPWEGTLYFTEKEFRDLMPIAGTEIIVSK